MAYMRLRHRLGRAMTAISREILAQEGYYAGLIWVPVNELTPSVSGSFPVVALINEAGSQFHVETVGDSAEWLARLETDFGWATNASVLVASDPHGAESLARDIRRRLSGRK
jgi:hypothetical protein